MTPTPTPTPSATPVPSWFTTWLSNIQAPDSNTSWGLLAAVIGIAITVWITIAIYKKQSQKKAMRIEVGSFNSLVRVSDKTSDIQVLYKGMPIGEVSVVGIQFTNTGNVDIDKEDFRGTPITFTFVPKLKLLSSSPGPLPYGLTLEHQFDNAPANNLLTVQPFALRQKESITLSVVIENLTKMPERLFEVSERMKDFRPVIGYTGRLTKPFRPIVNVAGTTAPLGLIFGVMMISLANNDNVRWVGAALVIIGLISLGILHWDSGKS